VSQRGGCHRGEKWGNGIRDTEDQGGSCYLSTEKKGPILVTIETRIGGELSGGAWREGEKVSRGRTG